MHLPDKMHIFKELHQVGRRFKISSGTGFCKDVRQVVPDRKTEWDEVQHVTNYAGCCVIFYVRCTSDEQDREFYLRPAGTTFTRIEGRIHHIVYYRYTISYID